jgi:cell division protease FtsH
MQLKPKFKQNPKGNMKGKMMPMKKPTSFWTNFISVFLIIIAIAVLYSYRTSEKDKPQQITISQLASDIQSEKVTKIQVNNPKVVAIYKGENNTEIKKEAVKEEETSIVETLTSYGVNNEQLKKVDILVDKPSNGDIWSILISAVLGPLIFIGLLIWYFSRMAKQAGVQPFSFGESKARFIGPDDQKQKVTFKDVAGAKEAKEELVEIVEFLKNPKKFHDIGARIPKGILLMGAPGTGKTLLARAVAGEAGVSFFSISGSEFVEMFVGVGASRVRDLFTLAKVASPSIIFIDEIDAVGRSRGVGIGGGNDEREQTLNQILVEMDGFEPTEKVIVMAATNRPDVLDHAILRPGRFDRRVVIELPDRKDREEILKVHIRNKPLAEDVNLPLLAERTPGFSGADIYSLVNEAAILTARENRKTVGQFDFIRSIEKVMLGPERRSHLLTEKEKEITAYHEAGHALVSSLLPNSDPVHKISIIARGRAGGYTLKLPAEDRKLQTKNEFLDDIAMTLGGYVAEKLIFGDITTGPSNDLQVATALARDMVTRYGMSDAIGPIALERARGKTIFGEGVDDKEYALEVANKIDVEVGKIMSEARVKASDILTKYKNVLDVIAKRLIEVETLERDEYEQILIAQGIPAHKHVKGALSKGLEIEG